MKKSYVKPQVYFEDFQLSASIAGDCDGDYIIKTLAKGTCGYQMTGLTIFLDSVLACKEENGGLPVEEGKYNGFCYHNVDGPFFAS